MVIIIILIGCHHPEMKGQTEMCSLHEIFISGNRLKEPNSLTLNVLILQCFCLK